MVNGHKSVFRYCHCKTVCIVVGTVYFVFLGCFMCDMNFKVLLHKMIRTHSDRVCRAAEKHFLQQMANNGSKYISMSFVESDHELSSSIGCPQKSLAIPKRI